MTTQTRVKELQDQVAYKQMKKANVLLQRFMFGQIRISFLQFKCLLEHNAGIPRRDT